MTKTKKSRKQAEPEGWWPRLRQRALNTWNYVSGGVWNDRRRTLGVSLVKTANLSVRSFLNGDIQTQACAMTYRTMLAVVPALALLFAIGRGFGLQTVLQDALLDYFPAQQKAIDFALNFVDSYLNQASEGLFVGVGVLFLLWTLISLVSSVENVFNMIWGVQNGRSIWHKITDYTAMLLILPVLMICAAGMNLLLSSTLRSIFDFAALTPLISWVLEGGSWVMTWMFFTAVYMLVPNTKVKLRNALVAGVIAGSAFMILQWLFVTGQMYVSRYNAIYGSFAFLPLLLIWLQLVWVITLSGAVICFSSQNIFRFSFDSEVSRMAPNYRSKTNVAITAVIVRRFDDQKPPVTADELVEAYDFPVRLVIETLDQLVRAGVVSRVLLNSKDAYGYQPAISPDNLTVGLLGSKLDAVGTRDFIPDFNKNFRGVQKTFAAIAAAVGPVADSTLLRDIEIVPLSAAAANHRETQAAERRSRHKLRI